MSEATKKNIGIFLGRLQPQHKGHENLIKTIFKENDEIILCIGSTQRLRKSDPDFARNPLSRNVRLKKLKAFLESRNFEKPFRIVTAIDIEPEEAWPVYLKKCCNIDDCNLNTIYFSDQISKDYKNELAMAGFKIKFTKRIKFLYKTNKKTAYKISSSTEIRTLEKI